MAAAPPAPTGGVPPKLLTLLIPVDERLKSAPLLLGEKLRGFGEGYYNGFGGKVEPGETVREGALRELQEEAGVDASSSAELRGLLVFHFDDKEQPWEVHVFWSSTDFGAGVPVETDEMRPVWFGFDEIPYGKMWADDVYWYPLFLDGGKRFRGEFWFQDTHTLHKHTLDEVECL